MALQRALDSGVTGMLNNQLSLDVVANNIANVNTPGFKGSRVSFANSLVQTTFAGSAPGTNIGGQNPQQVGLGVQTTSIDIDMSQGALAATGRNLDLAVQGEGFFELTDGIRSLYTRVGSFDIDSNNSLVHVGTGFRVQGNTYRTDLNPDGTQSIQDINVPITIDQSAPFPPSRTTEIDFQGNLSAATQALQGTSLQSVYQFKSTLTGNAATEDTPLSELNIFNGQAIPAAAVDQVKTIYMFGTKPDGTTYAADFEINPWATPTTGSNVGTLSEFVTNLNNAFVQGSERFATARLENGNLVVSTVGDGEAFSVFFGEDGAVPSTATAGTPPFFSTAAAAGTHVNTGALDTTTLTSATTSASDTVLTGGAGLLNPTFTLGGAVPTVPFSISVQVNNSEVGSITIPAGAAIGDTFSLDSYPHIAAGDQIDYVVTNIPAAATIDASTSIILDSNTANLTQDADGDGQADMFVEDSPVDANAWAYENNTNSTFNWYRVRSVPEVVGTSIEVYDSQGGRHNLEARFFRIGTKTPAGSSERINSWDMIIDIPFGEGTIVDDLVTGIEFDQEGRYTGSIGTTIHDTSLNATNYVGNPSSGTIQVDWATTGPTDPATIVMDFGPNNSVEGLTGFGSTSTAAMIDQNGFTDGKLDAISVSAEGDIVALYTNGISRRLAQIPLVTFRNAAGLQSSEGSLWQISTNSGSPTRRTAGQNAGLITSGALESANVDIATEFTRLITSQRGFQVSARVVQTTDEVLEELANLVR